MAKSRIEIWPENIEKARKKLKPRQSLTSYINLLLEKALK